jgi:hypothetical protein
MYLFCLDQYVFTCQNRVIDDEGDGGGIPSFDFSLDMAIDELFFFILKYIFLFNALVFLFF